MGCLLALSCVLKVIALSRSTPYTGWSHAPFPPTLLHGWPTHPQVRGSAAALLSHDFWGTAMVDGASHRSWRPLAVATFRLDAWLTWRLFGPGGTWSSSSSSSSSSSTSSSSLSTSLSSPAAVRELLKAQPAVLRFTNALLHGAAALAFAFLARRLFVRPPPPPPPPHETTPGLWGALAPAWKDFVGSGEATALAAGLLFAAHPVHVRGPVFWTVEAENAFVLVRVSGSNFFGSACFVLLHCRRRASDRWWGGPSS